MDRQHGIDPCRSPTPGAAGSVGDLQEIAGLDAWPGSVSGSWRAAAVWFGDCLRAAGRPAVA
jgi:hypothetical protein